MNTVIYLIKHATTMDEDGIRNTSETSQMINEKEILSIKGEEEAKRLSENPELQNIDILWSSSYARAKCTAKYISDKNNIKINIDSSLNERKLGNLEELSEFMKDKPYGVVQAYLSDKKWKTSDGESCEEATKRITEFMKKILKENKGKKIAIVSHGALISFLLTNWCELNKEMKLVYKEKIIDIKEPSITKLTFKDNELLNIEQEKIVEEYRKVDACKYIGKEVYVKIDRPLGSSHPKHHNHIYLVNYGFVPNTISGDGEELDCYVLGEYKPIKEYKGKCIAVIHRLNEDDDKLIIVAENKNYTDNEIRLLTDFQEKYYKSVIIR